MINPVGTYLVDLDSYLKSGKDKDDVKMFTEEEMANIEQTKMIRNNTP